MYKYISICVCVGGEDGLGVEGLSEPYVVRLNMCVVELCLENLVVVEQVLDWSVTGM